MIFNRRFKCEKVLKIETILVSFFCSTTQINENKKN